MKGIDKTAFVALILAFTAAVVDAQVAWNTHTLSNSFPAASSVQAADLDQDGDTDIVGASYGNTVCWWENDGSQNFTQNTIDGTLNHPAYVKVIDFDRDNDLDLILSNTYSDEILWFENNGSEEFTRHLVGGNFAWPRDNYAIDLDGDGDTDVICASDRPNAIRWWQNSGNNLTFTEISIKENWSGAWGVWAGDLDGDQDVDILGTAINADQIIWFENNGSQVFTEHILESSFEQAWTVEVCDLDNDSDPDVVAGGYPGLKWYENNGSQVFTPHNLDDHFHRARSVKAGDIDGDGDLDLAGASYTYDKVAWFENNGSQVFRQHVILTDIDGANGVSLADIDGDRKPDLAAAVMGDNKVLWWNNYRPIPLNIAMTPHNTPIQIPAGGGVFSFRAEVESAFYSPLIFDVWTEVNLPNGAVYSPFLIRIGVNMPGYETFRRRLVQSVPQNAPAGNYQYAGKVGIYPDSVISSDSFPFTKLLNDGIQTHNQGWECCGWDDENGFSILNSQSLILNSSPNPFNASTALSYKLQAASNVKLAIYDIAGREVAVIAQGFYPAGNHQAIWYASGKASGVYFARLKAGEQSYTQKLLLVK